MNSFEWAITEPVNVTQIDDNVYRIEQISPPGAELLLSFHRDAVPGRTIHINGEYVDLGDDTIAYISLIDEYHEQSRGGIGITIMSKPYSEHGFTDDGAPENWME